MDPGRWIACVACVALSAGVASADDAEPPPADRDDAINAATVPASDREVEREARPPVPVPYRPAAEPVTDEALDRAPPPDQASNVVQAAPETDDRRAARAVLWPVRMAARGVLAPVRMAMWAEDRYAATAKARQTFWNQDRTIGLYPVATWEGGATLSGGIGFDHHDLSGATAQTRVTFGTSERVMVAGTMGTGTSLGRLQLFVGGRFRQVASSDFYGYGDRDGLDAPPEAAVDPLDPARAYHARFAVTEEMGRAGAAWKVRDRVFLGLGGSVRRLRFADAYNLFEQDPEPIGDIYDTSRLPGWDGVLAGRAEAQIMIDQRRVADRLMSAAVPSSGWAAQLYGGWHEGIDDDTSRFAYGGADWIGYLDVYGGDRVLSLRLTVDGAVAPIEDIPFTELPALGGPYLLRGYHTARYRDRWSAAASLEYSWPVTEGFAGFAFVDAGRVARVPVELDDELPRAATGLGLQVHSKRNLLARAWLSVTAEGGFMTNLKLDAAFARRPREWMR